MFFAISPCSHRHVAYRIRLTACASVSARWNFLDCMGTLVQCEMERERRIVQGLNMNGESKVVDREIAKHGCTSPPLSVLHRCGHLDGSYEELHEEGDVGNRMGKRGGTDRRTQCETPRRLKNLPRHIRRAFLLRA